MLRQSLRAQQYKSQIRVPVRAIPADKNSHPPAPKLRHAIIIKCHTAAAAGVGRFTIPCPIVQGCDNVLVYDRWCLSSEDVFVVGSTFECETTLWI